MVMQKDQQPQKTFDLPKGAPYVPTVLPRLPDATGTNRLETTKKPRKVGVATPIEKRAALARANTGQRFQPRAAEMGGGGKGDSQYQYEEPVNYAASLIAAGDAMGGLAPVAVPPVPDKEYADDGGVIGANVGGKSYYNVPTTDPDHPDYTDPHIPAELTAPDGTVYDATDQNSPYYDPELDPNNKAHFNPDKFALMKGQADTKSSGDAALESKLNSIKEANLAAAAQAKRRLMAQYGSAGFAGSGQYMQEMGQIDIQFQRATTEAQADLMVEKMKMDQDRDIELLRQRLEFATGEEAEQLQKDLTQMMLDRDKEDQLLEQFFGAPEHLKDVFGADSFDPASYQDFMSDMSEAEASGDATNIYKVMSNVHYVDGQLYYRSEWANPMDGPIGLDGTVGSKNNWTVFFLDNPGMSLSELREWLIKNGYDPSKALELMQKYKPKPGQTEDTDISGWEWTTGIPDMWD